MDIKRFLAAISKMDEVEPSQNLLEALAQFAIRITEEELAELMRILAMKYGIVPVKSYAILRGDLSKIAILPQEPQRKEKMFVPKSIGRVRNKALGNRCR